MKMYYGGTPIKSLNVKHYEMSTSDATVQPSDLQSGVTCYARGQKLLVLVGVLNLQCMAA